MEGLRAVMAELDGADPATVRRVAAEKGSLVVRLAMLGLASVAKGTSSLWFTYPPGVFIAYKRGGAAEREMVTALADHVRGLGYRPFLDVESLDELADNYFEVPAFIASLQDCTFYVLLLTELSADLITARRGKTSWVHDEYEHALRLANAGRLVIVPVLLEPGGATDEFTPRNALDLSSDPRDFRRLDGVLTPDPVALDAGEVVALEAAMGEFDARFLSSEWDAARAVLARSAALAETFDHRLRQMLLALYTADEPAFEAALDALVPVYGEQLVYHFYAGYCARHGIPDRMVERR